MSWQDPPPPPPPGSWPPPPSGPQQPPPPGSWNDPSGGGGVSFGVPYGTPPPDYAAYGQAAMAAHMAAHPRLPPLAANGSKFVSLMLDGIIVALFFIPGVVAFVTGPTEIGTCTRSDGSEYFCNQPTGSTVALGLGLLAAAFVAGFLYYTLPVSRSGQTWAMRIMGLRILDARTLRPPSYGKAVGRYLFAGFISGQVCYLGYIWAFFDGERRTWHDMVCDTRVVRAH